MKGSGVKPEVLWRCEKCGCEYVCDIGTCGSLVPPCDGTVRRVSESARWAEVAHDLYAALEEHEHNFGGITETDAKALAAYRALAGEAKT